MLTDQFLIPWVNNQFIKRLVKKGAEISHKETINWVIHSVEENKSIFVPTPTGPSNLLPGRHYAGWEPRQNDTI